MQARFIKRVKETKTNIYSFYFEPEQKLHFIAGQFTEIALGRTSHWFTISSSPGGKLFSITTRQTTSRFKQSLFSLKPGESINFAEPMGDFVLPKNLGIPILLVAAGIGITPYLSILADQSKKDEVRNLNLIYGSSSEKDFLDISSYLSLLKGYSPVVGRLAAKAIYTTSLELEQPYIYLSGPEKMVEALTKQLTILGADAARLITDYFPGYD